MPLLHCVHYFDWIVLKVDLCVHCIHLFVSLFKLEYGLEAPYRRPLSPVMCLVLQPLYLVLTC